MKWQIVAQIITFCYLGGRTILWAQEFEASLVNIVKPYLKTEKKNAYLQLVPN
jgi:hypothetical protein